jgi:MATE family multidrug resistance protein
MDLQQCIAASVIYAITGSLGIFSVAYNIIAADAMGKRDKNMFEKAFYSAMLFSIVVGIFFIVLSLIFGKVFFEYAYGLNGDILKVILQYYYPESVTVLLNMIIFVFSAYFKNIQNTRITFFSTITATVVNVFFDYVLVYGKFIFPELGVSGAAWGSVIGLIAGIMVYFIAIVIFDKKIIVISFDLKSIRRMIKLYVPLLGQDIMEFTVYAMALSGIISRLGTNNIASYSLLDGLGNIIILPVCAYSTSAMTLAIQKKASGDELAIKLIIKAATFLSVIVISSISIACLIFPVMIMRLIISDIRVIAAAKTLIIYLVAAQIINIFYQIYKSYLQGTGKEKFVFAISTVISLLSLILIYILSTIAGVEGVYIGLALKYLILAVICFFRSSLS